MWHTYIIYIYVYIYIYIYVHAYIRTRIHAHAWMPHVCMYVSLPIFGMGLFQFGAPFFLRASQPKEIEEGFKTSHAS